MRFARAAAGVLLLLLLLSTTAAHGACDPDGADASDVAAARAAIAAACDCATAPNHASFVRCARAVAKATLVNDRCVGVLTRCASRSTCGRPDAVACCRTDARGVTVASIKPRASACRAPAGGSACVREDTSLCDACTATGCAAPPTPTVAPTPTPSPSPTPTLPPPPPSPTPTPPLVPGVCGDGVLNLGEECDGPVCAAVRNGQAVTSQCGAPESAHPCECRATQCGGCLEGDEEGVLCWSDDVCAITPSGAPNCVGGLCIPTSCTSHAECNPEFMACQGGTCCVASFAPPAICRLADQFELPCCGNAVCPPGDFATCCLPAGESCSDGATCCSGTCSAGSCG